MHTIAIVKEVCYFKSAKIADHRFIQRLKRWIKFTKLLKKILSGKFYLKVGYKKKK